MKKYFYATQKNGGSDVKEILCFESIKERNDYCAATDYSEKISAPKDLTQEEIYEMLYRTDQIAK